MTIYINVHLAVSNLGILQCLNSSTLFIKLYSKILLFKVAKLPILDVRLIGGYTLTCHNMTLPR